MVKMKTNRGPKPKTSKNAPAVVAKVTGDITWEPVVPLEGSSLDEFWRLLHQLDRRGTLDRVDMAVITECARVTGRLNQAYKLDETKIINQLTTQRRGLLRELGLTLQPSRSVVKTIAKDPSQADPLASKIKLHG